MYSATISDEFPLLDDSLDSRQPERWHEDKTPFRKKLLIDASTYRPEPLFNLAPERHPTNLVASPNGRFAYANRILPGGAELWTADDRGVQGTVSFTGDVVIPTLYDFSRRPELPVWMSLTPMEVFTLRPGVMRARGKVIIAGLGLGWFLRKVHQRISVNEIVLVEKDQGLLDWFGYGMCRKLPKVTDVICDDAYRHLGKHGRRTCYLYDIWPTLGCARRDRKFQAKKRGLTTVWGWGE